MNERACPLCGGAERKLLAHRDRWDIVRCAHCEMVFLGAGLPYDVQAGEYDWVEEHTKEFSRRKRKQPMMVFLSRCTRWLHPEPTQRLLAQTLRWCGEGKLVDFGCGDGRFVAAASKYFDVTGIELSPRGVQLSRQKVTPEKVLEGPVTEIAERDLSPDSFDIVTQFGYIEHEWWPIAALQAAWRVLRPGGLTVIKTPNYASWNRRVMGMDWCGYHIPAHCNYFTPATLAKMLRKVGFKPMPRPLADCLPTSDSLWMAATKQE